MAYREFHFEKTYAKPDTSGFLQQAAASASQAIGNIFSSIAQKKQQERAKADSYNLVLEKGVSENDNILFEEQTKAAVGLYKEGVYTNNKNKQQQALDIAETAKSGHNQMRLQSDKLKRANAAVDETVKNNQYYKGNIDKDMLNIAFNGKDGNGNYLTRDPALNEAITIAGKNPRAFDLPKYTADWVNKIQGERSAETSSDDPSKAKTTSLKSPFLNTDTGVLGADQDDAVRYLKSDPDGFVQKNYELQLNDQLDEEIKQMKADPANMKHFWMRDKSDLEIKNALISGEKENTINNKDYNTRVNELAISALNEAAHISSKVNVEQKIDTAATQGLYNNGGITHRQGFQNETVPVDASVSYAPGGETESPLYKTGQIVGPGGNIMIAKGPTVGNAVKMQLSAKTTYDMESGKVIENIGGTSTHNVISWLGLGYYKNGRPEIMREDIKTTDDQVNFYNTAKPSYFKHLNPKIDIAFKTFQINKDAMLGDVKKSITELNQKLAEATKAGKTAEVENLKGQIRQREKYRTKFDPDKKYSDEDIVNTGAENGITERRTNYIVKGEDNDFSTLDGVTQGLDLRKDDKVTQDYLRVRKARTDAYNRAKALNFKDQPTDKKKAATTKAPLKAAAAQPVKTTGTVDIGLQF
jgi:hypothetical protein